MTDSFRRPSLPPAAFVVASLLVVALYVALVWPAMHGPFVFDDFPNLAALANVDAIDGWRDIGAYLAESRFFPGRPLAMLSFLPQREAWPTDPYPFKVVNLGLHLVNAVLAGWLAFRLARTRLPAARAMVVAFVAATAWLAMPMHLSAVLLVVQRMTLLSTAFVLLGLAIYVHALASDASAARRGLLMALGLVGGTTLALLCKETGVLLPLLAWVTDATLLRERRDALPASLRRLRALLVYPAAALLAGYLLSRLPGMFDALGYRDFTIAERLLTQPRLLLAMLGQSLLPRYGQYSVFHDDEVASRGLLDPWTTLPALLIVLGAAAWALRSRARLPLAAFAVLWFLAGHLLEAGPLPLELRFDHRNYLPILGPVIAAVIALAGLPAGGLRRATVGLFSLWLMAGLLASALYARVWGETDRLAYFWADAHPASIRAQEFYAQTLYDHGMAKAASGVLERLERRRPGDAGVAVNRLFVDCARQAATPADVERVRRHLATARWSRGAFQSLKPLRVIAAAGRCEALDGAAWLRLSDALLANPAFRSDPIAMGMVHYERHELAVSRGDLDGAMRELDQVARHDPDPEIVRRQARYLVDAGLRAEAIRLLESYDASRRPLLRRLLVDDEAANAQAIAAIRAGKATPAPPPGERP